MPSPFPGMDPYLERSDLWPQVHNRLIIATADALTPQIAPRYSASIEERIYTTGKRRFLSIRATENNEVITVIEILSPANKRSGEGRDTYKAKRQQVLGSKTNFIEIDLLRSGESMPVYGPLTSPYRILVSRGTDRPKAELYPFALPESLPTFPVPLRPSETEPAIVLQQLLNDIYDRARFDLAIDYSTALKPKLTDPDAQWVSELLSGL